MVDRRAGRKIEAPPNKLIRRFRVASGDAALGIVLLGCEPVACATMSARFYLAVGSPYICFRCLSPAFHWVIEPQKSICPIFASSLANMFVR